MTKPDEYRMRVLERAIYETIRDYPGRIDQMETRNEEACRKLARTIIGLVEDAVTDS